MSEPKQNDPFQGEQPSSDEYGFDPDADPVEKDELQAEAQEYGIYGYQGEPGEAFEGDPGEGTSPAPEPPEDETPDVAPPKGGQEWNETEHGAGFAQPMESPQRHASDSELPEEADEE